MAFGPQTRKKKLDDFIICLIAIWPYCLIPLGLSNKNEHTTSCIFTYLLIYLLSLLWFFKATVAEIMIYCRGSQADMSPLSTIAAITLPWSIVLHDSLQKGPILHPLPIHLILLHFQASLPPCLIYSILFLVLLYLLCHPYLPFILHTFPSVLVPLFSSCIFPLLIPLPSTHFLLHLSCPYPILFPTFLNPSMILHLLSPWPPSFHAIPVFCHSLCVSSPSPTNTFITSYLPPSLILILKLYTMYLPSLSSFCLPIHSLLFSHHQSLFLNPLSLNSRFYHDAQFLATLFEFWQ